MKPNFLPRPFPQVLPHPQPVREHVNQFAWISTGKSRAGLAGLARRWELPSVRRARYQAGVGSAIPLLPNTASKSGTCPRPANGPNVPVSR